MYIFVFLWVPSMQEASPSSTSTSLPLGYIFSAFMVSMMLGSLLYTAIVASHQRRLAQSPKNIDSALALHAKLSSLVCAASALALATCVASADEHVRFWAFCAFEACVGMYYPVQGTLRGTLISNEHRATVRLAAEFSLFNLITHELAAVVIVPRAAQHFRRRVAPDWRLLRAASRPHGVRSDARLLFGHDGCCHRRQS